MCTLNPSEEKNGSTTLNILEKESSKEWMLIKDKAVWNEKK